MRATTKAGVLFYVYGGGDLLSISIEKNGSIKVVCNNGGGTFSVSYKPEPSVCNGEFYSILLVKKLKTLTLTVNGAVTEETTTKSSTSADTNSPAYFGGLPENLQSSWAKSSDSKYFIFENVNFLSTKIPFLNVFSGLFSSILYYRF